MRRIYAVMLACLLCLAAAASAGAAALGHTPEGAFTMPAPLTYRAFTGLSEGEYLLRRGDSGDAVRETQNRLRGVGLVSGRGHGRL